MEKRKYSEQFLLRISPDQKKLFQEAADHAGIQLTSWIRSVLMKAARQELK